MQKIRSFSFAFRLPILSGLFIGTSYIPYPPWALFFGLAPLFIFWRTLATDETMPLKRAGRLAFFGGWITQFILSLIGFPWIAYTAVEFGHFPWWGGGLSLLGFAAIAHLHYPIAGWLSIQMVRRLRLSPVVVFLVFAATFALCEHHFPMIFPWHLGYPWLWAGLPGAQFADVIGFEGLNVVTIFANCLIAWAVADAIAIRTQKGSMKRPLILVGSAIALILAVNIAGFGREIPWQKTDSVLPVLAVQGNIGNFDKLMAEKGRNFRDPIISKYISLSQAGLAANPDVKMVIWPETAFPDILDVPYQSDPTVVSVREFVKSSNVGLMTGSYSYEHLMKVTYNGFFFMNELGITPETPHRKSILLVFGETFPFSDTIPYMTKLFPDLGSFGRGDGPKTLTISAPGVAPVKIGPQICYEGLYPWFTAELSRKGAVVFTNVTNDSWFGKRFEPYQHLYMTLARAIEFRRPLLRSTNTGITTAILASGEILEFSPQDKEWSGVYRIRYQSNPEHTFFEKIADRWGWVLTFILAALLAVGKIWGRRAGENHK